MTEAQSAAYVFSMAVCAQAEIAAMQANNLFVEHGRQPFDYPEFMAVIEKYGIHHNAVLTLFGETSP